MPKKESVEMEEGFKKGLDGCPQLLHLIQNQGDWMVSRGNSGGQSCVGAVEEKKLELRLGLPSGEEWSTVKERDREQAHSVESHGGHFSKVAKSNISNFCVGSNGGFLGSVELNSQGNKFFIFTSLSCCWNFGSCFYLL